MVSVLDPLFRCQTSRTAKPGRSVTNHGCKTPAGTSSHQLRPTPRRQPVKSNRSESSIPRAGDAWPSIPFEKRGKHSFRWAFSNPVSLPRVILRADRKRRKLQVRGSGRLQVGPDHLAGPRGKRRRQAILDAVRTTTFSSLIACIAMCKMDRGLAIQVPFGNRDLLPGTHPGAHAPGSPSSTFVCRFPLAPWERAGMRAASILLVTAAGTPPLPAAPSTPPDQSPAAPRPTVRHLFQTGGRRRRSAASISGRTTSNPNLS